MGHNGGSRKTGVFAMTTITIYEAKKRRHPTLDEYKRVAQLFDWAGRVHFTLYFHGENIRDGRSERVLKLLKDQEYLIAQVFGKVLIYSVRRRNRDGKHRGAEQIEHGLGHTIGLVRVRLADNQGIFSSGRNYKEYGFVPEWEVIYPTGKKLLFEFCTRDNFHRALKSKVERYQYFLAENDNTSVLFVLDVERSEIIDFINKIQPIGPMAFTDYTTFRNVPFGEQLKAPIYLWRDGQARPLRQ